MKNQKANKSKNEVLKNQQSKKKFDSKKRYFKNTKNIIKLKKQESSMIT